MWSWSWVKGTGHMWVGTLVYCVCLGLQGRACVSLKGNECNLGKAVAWNPVRERGGEKDRDRTTAKMTLLFTQLPRRQKVSICAHAWKLPSIFSSRQVCVIVFYVIYAQLKAQINITIRLTVLHGNKGGCELLRVCVLMKIKLSCWLWQISAPLHRLNFQLERATLVQSIKDLQHLYTPFYRAASPANSPHMEPLIPAEHAHALINRDGSAVTHKRLLKNRRTLG